MIKYLLFKYLRFDKAQPFITLSAFLAFFGVSVGLMVLIIAMGIMNGFDKEFERKLFVMNYPITIFSHFKGQVNENLVKTLEEKFPTMIFSPYISSQVMYKTQDSFEGGIVFGVDFEREEKINPIIKEALRDKNLTSPFSILLGSSLKEQEDFMNGDKVTLIFTKLQASGFSMMPQMKRFEVKGAFHSGLIAYDKAYSFVNNKDLAKVLDYGADQFDGIHVYSKNPMKDIEELREELGFGYRTLGWWQQNGNFFSALALEKRALFIVLMLIILVASLNIVSSILMTIMNRRQEIALLMTLGASKKDVKNTFFALGLVIGGSGIILGAFLGLLGVYILGNFNIISLPADVYGTSKLFMELSFLDFSLIIFGASAIVAFSSYYPAKKASEVDLLSTLRNE